MAIKNESLKDLINWVKSLPKNKKKININIDEIVYGVKK